MKEAGLICATRESVPLTAVAVTGNISSGHACVRVKQTYRNTGARPIEAIYTFPLPAEAVLAGFNMTCAGRTQTGVVKEREEAFRAYDDALVAGHGAALLEEERPNVFTASVGNVLPGEDVEIELEYIERLFAEEGALRFMLPTLVAPRYVPGEPAGDRTAHGLSEPTLRVPDADRISPPRSANVQYRLSLSLSLDVGKDVVIESPSHVVQTRDVGDRGEKKLVTFESEPLDRDFVLLVSGAAPGDSASVAAHRAPGAEQGYVALTVVPDLFDQKEEEQRLTCVFLLDRSGSMGGASMTQARTALRLCLRQLKEGDRFNIIAFDDYMETLHMEPVVFSGRTLAEADAFLERVDARGGTELLGPLLHAVGMAKDGLVVLLTDGQVANEDEIFSRVSAARMGTRISSFGIGTNVSTALLSNLAKATNGALDMIYPGERIDEKVALSFARATAARITDISVTFEGVFLGEIAPNPPRDLVDGEPWTLFATYDEPGMGHATIRGKKNGQAFALQVPVWLPENESTPFVERLWAKERIKALLGAELDGRRAAAMKARIVELCTKHGIASKYASFVVIEKRKGERRQSEQAETHVVPVSLPAGWSMFADGAKGGFAGGRQMAMSKSIGGAMPPGAVLRSPGPTLSAPRPAQGMPPPPAPARASSGGPPPPAVRPSRPTGAPQAPRAAAMLRSPSMDEGVSQNWVDRLAKPAAPARDTMPAIGEDSTATAFANQGASGLWGDETALPDGCAETFRVLSALFAIGMDASHSVYGAQVRKAIDALIKYAPGLGDQDLRARILVLAWLMSGRRTRALVVAEAASTAAANHLTTEDVARAFLTHAVP